MNWVIYATFTLTRLTIILGLVLLSILTVPVILCLLCMGMLLAYLRDIEPALYVEKPPVFDLENVKAIYFFVITQTISSLQRIPSIRNKSSF